MKQSRQIFNNSYNTDFQRGKKGNPFFPQKNQGPLSPKVPFFGSREMLQPVIQMNQNEVLQAKWTDDVMNVATGIGSGIVSVGEDLVGGVNRTSRELFTPDERAQISAENERALNLIISLINNRDILSKVVQFTIQDIYTSLPPNLKEKVRKKLTDGAKRGAGYTIGRLVIGTTIAKSIARRVATQIATSQVFKALAIRLGLSASVGATGIGLVITLTMIQGVLERAAQASNRLRTDHPGLHELLVAQNLDMAWFIVEPHFEEIRNELVE